MKHEGLRSVEFSLKYFIDASLVHLSTSFIGIKYFPKFAIMGAAGSIGAGHMKAELEVAPEKAPSTDNSISGRSSTSIKYFSVKLLMWEGAPSQIKFNQIFVLSLGSESLDFISMSTKVPFFQVPYHNIACWGSTSSTFEFQMFTCEIDELPTNSNRIPVTVQTNEGKKIEDAIMSTVRHLMSEMDKHAMTKREFSELMTTIFDHAGKLHENWMKTIDQFTTNRYFLAKQAIRLLSMIGNEMSFEKLDLACLVYERMMNKDSFQLIINSLEDLIEKENLIHRLQNDYKKFNFSAVSNCSSITDDALINS